MRGHSSGSQAVQARWRGHGNEDHCTALCTRGTFQQHSQEIERKDKCLFASKILLKSLHKRSFPKVHGHASSVKARHEFQDFCTQRNLSFNSIITKLFKCPYAPSSHTQKQQRVRRNRQKGQRKPFNIANSITARSQGAKHLGHSCQSHQTLQRREDNQHNEEQSTTLSLPKHFLGGADDC